MAHIVRHFFCLSPAPLSLHTPDRLCYSRIDLTLTFAPLYTLLHRHMRDRLYRSL